MRQDIGQEGQRAGWQGSHRGVQGIFLSEVKLWQASDPVKKFYRRWPVNFPSIVPGPCRDWAISKHPAAKEKV